MRKGEVVWQVRSSCCAPHLLPWHPPVGALCCVVLGRCVVMGATAVYPCLDVLCMSSGIAVLFLTFYHFCVLCGSAHVRHKPLTPVMVIPNILSMHLRWALAAASSATVRCGRRRGASRTSATLPGRT